MNIDHRLVKLLQEFQQALAELGIPTSFLNSSAEHPLPSVVVQAPPDSQGRERSVLLAFIPDDGEFQEIDLLQLYMPVPNSQTENDLATTLIHINEKAILGHAGMMPSGEIYWRHVWPIPRGLPIIPSVLLEVIQFFVFSAESGMEENRQR